MEAKNCKILVVEDEEAVLRLLITSLKRAGYTAVTSANSVGKALEAIAADMPQLLVTDFRLGTSGTGAAVIAALRGIDPVFPVIIMTGSYEVDKAAILACYPDDILNKPFEVADFLQTVLVMTEAIARS